MALILTIKSVQLKDSAGQWFTVIEPDHQVDLATQEPGLSFFNEGRVPAGDYVNVKIAVTGLRPEDGARQSTLAAAKDFAAPLAVRKNSFIGIWFKFDDLSRPASVHEASITIDDKTTLLTAESLKLDI